MKKGYNLLMDVNNTVRAKLYVMYPGDESLMIYEEYPYEGPKPIMINPETGVLWMKLKMVANRPNWRPLIHNYSSKFRYQITEELGAEWEVCSNKNSKQDYVILKAKYIFCPDFHLQDAFRKTLWNR